MGLNFRKSIKLAPGVKLNLGKKSAGISLGGKYGGVSFNSRTGARARVSAPGTGISYTTKIGSKKKSKATTTSIPSDGDSKKGGNGCLMSCLKGFGVLFLISIVFSSCFTDDSSSDTIIPTEISSETTDNEITETETSTQITTELSNTLETEMPTEIANVTEGTETTTVNANTEILSEPETSVATQQIPVQTPTSSEKKEVLVWIDDTAARYHSKNGCGMNNAYQVTLEKAQAMGKTPCGRCYK